MKRLFALIGLIGLTTAAVHAEPPGTEDEIRARLQPVGSVCREGDDCGTSTASTASGPLSGEAVYNQFCFACHMTGASGAPKLDDAGVWKPRIAKGMDTLWQSAVKGLGVMPPKGTCMNCSDAELRSAVEFMVNSLP